MQLKALKVYCDVITCRSFSRAAVENGVSQSGVSQIVGQLEEHLGAKLIDRSKRPFVLTSEGDLFFQGCKKMLQKFEALEEEVRAIKLDVAGRVSVASIYSTGLNQLNGRVQNFLQTNPKANVRLEYQHPTRVVEMVENDMVDIGMVSYPKSTRTLKATMLQDEPMVVVCSPEHPFAKARDGGQQQASIPLRELHEANFVGFDDGLKIRRELDRAFAAENIEPRHMMEFDNIETIKRAVEINAGVSLLPEPTVQRELQLKTLVALPLKDIQLTRPIGMLIRQGSTLGKTAKRFVEFLETTWLNPADQSSAAASCNAAATNGDAMNRDAAKGEMSNGNGRPVDSNGHVDADSANGKRQV